MPVITTRSHPDREIANAATAAIPVLSNANWIKVRDPLVNARAKTTNEEITPNFVTDVT